MDRLPRQSVRLRSPKSGLKWIDAGRAEREIERGREAKWPDLFVPRCSDCEADKAKRYEGQASEAAADEVALIFNGTRDLQI